MIRNSYFDHRVKLSDQMSIAIWVETISVIKTIEIAKICSSKLIEYISYLIINNRTNKGEKNMKRYINLSLLYAILAMIGGVFYREFTKFNGFAGKTTLGVVHTHYFLLGMVFFLLLLLLEKNFSFTVAKTTRILVIYQIGLNLTAAMFVVRGVIQVLGTSLSYGMSAAISGVAGIGHILLGISLVLVLVQIKRSISDVKA